jgi:hypothetical protein
VLGVLPRPGRALLGIGGDRLMLPGQVLARLPGQGQSQI